MRTVSVSRLIKAVLRVAPPDAHEKEAPMALPWQCKRAYQLATHPLAHMRCAGSGCLGRHLRTPCLGKDRAVHRK